MSRTVEHPLIAAPSLSSDLLSARFRQFPEHAELERQERQLDESLMLTFPASDPVSSGFFT
ncbi:hypothetical protein [Paraburkholderia sp. BL10I2N1]|uniref:hypothetical protein n=1 Tax=Paraburkholderia sp. BL10I2N1 TaxID=1938796 RepID=UPI00105BAF82|nr:hypothetical protein [Paraburkholderia sp. BL10I2N1]TDN62589.1 hypothetical protein B0G77_6169 [Paraburkholderia sp. BL10I2N1]